MGGDLLACWDFGYMNCGFWNRGMNGQTRSRSGRDTHIVSGQRTHNTNAATTFVCCKSNLIYNNAMLARINMTSFQSMQPESAQYMFFVGELVVEIHLETKYQLKVKLKKYHTLRVAQIKGLSHILRLNHQCSTADQHELVTLIVAPNKHL